MTFCVYVLLNKSRIVILFRNRIVPIVFMCALKKKDHSAQTPQNTFIRNTSSEKYSDEKNGENRDE